jgi:hypothetical protein
MVSSGGQGNKKVIYEIASNDIELGDPRFNASETLQQMLKK